MIKDKDKTTKLHGISEAHKLAGINITDIPEREIGMEKKTIEQ